MSTTSLITFAEFEQLPETEGKQELIDGETVTMPPPRHSHNKIGKKIYSLLLAHLGDDRVWYDNEGYRIAGGWLVPDVSVNWPSQRYENEYAIGSPMIAVEILSPGEEVERKITLYFEDGAQEVWVIDVPHKSMTAYVKESGNVLRHSVEREYYSESIQFTLRLAEIFE